MSEQSIPAGAAPRDFDRKAAYRSIGISLIINGALPYAIYKFLAPHYPPTSVLPFVYASAFPVVGLVANFIRSRVVDMIAVIALIGLSYAVITALLAGEIRFAMIMSSMQNFVIAALFLGSVLIGRPMIFYISRQFAAGNDPVFRQMFTAANAHDGGRACRNATLVWVVALIGMGITAYVLAKTLSPANYLLAANVMNIVVNVVLVVWTIRYVSVHLERAGEALRAARN
jgi:hypothetical protein